jgi:geranylgeranylglycerol-phosphate geranylgeranyltransferase
MISYIRIIRPVNAFLASVGVILGFWLSGIQAPYLHLLLLVVATICALGFGNVINDIRDAESDKINHPQRPIPKGDISPVQALIFIVILAVISLIAGKLVSLYHFFGVCAPLILLLLYTLLLKGVPLIGNIVISILVSYSLIFGGLNSPGLHTLYLPAVLAFLLNLAREIVKDLQDREGDLKSGVSTTASLSEKTVTILLLIPGIIYIPLMYLPFYLNHFHYTYLVICTVVLLPIHLFWLFFLVIKNKMQNQSLISTLIKIEMLGGLAALAVDKLIV